MMRASRSFTVACWVAPKSDKKEKPRERKEPVKAVQETKITVTAIPVPAELAKPMVIPAKTQPSTGVPTRHSVSRGQSLPTRKRNGAVSPAVAAVLSSTAIPSRRKAGPRKTVLTAVAEDEKSAEISRSVMDVLLSPPDEEDDPLTKRMKGHHMLRENSSDSIPSLDTDDDDSISSTSLPATPRSGSRVRAASIGERRMKLLSLSVQECLEDHPLHFAAGDSDLDLVAPQPAKEEEARSTAKKRTFFKSNLTASLRVLKSAAKSFSSLNPSVTHRDDFLTRSILSISPQFTDERRPSINETPTPALRRYLNPSVTNIKLRAGRRHASAQTNMPDESITSIQLQTYQVSKAAKKALFANLPTPSSDPVQTNPVGRQRELRENPDFLRVIVLEMNMRRLGKLTEYPHGKARFVLPPRQLPKPQSLEHGLTSLPSRWVAMVPSQDDD